MTLASEVPGYTTQYEIYQKKMDEYFAKKAGNNPSPMKSDKPKRKKKPRPAWVSSSEARERMLWDKYNLTPGMFNTMLEEQDGGCAICGRESQKGNLHVDHDHDTGKVRGLLCRNCNLALGLMDDDRRRLGAAIRYLTEHINN